MWERVRTFNDDQSNKSGTLSWWDHLVKPGIRKIVLERIKEMYVARKEVLHLKESEKVQHPSSVQGASKKSGISELRMFYVIFFPFDEFSGKIFIFPEN